MIELFIEHFSSRTLTLRAGTLATSPRSPFGRAHCSLDTPERSGKLQRQACLADERDFVRHTSTGSLPSAL